MLFAEVLLLIVACQLIFNCAARGENYFDVDYVMDNVPFAMSAYSQKHISVVQHCCVEIIMLKQLANVG